MKDQLPLELARPSWWIDRYHRLTDSDAHPLVAPALAVVLWAMIFYKQLERDRAFIRAAALAYASLVALVPMLLLLFGVVRLTGQSGTFEVLEAFLFETLLGNMQPVREVLEPGLLSVDLGALGVVGVAGLVVVSARIYLLVEAAYCDIFDVPIDRPFTTRLLNFYLMMTLGPLVVATTLVGTTEVVDGFGLSWVSHRFTLLMQFLLLLTATKAFPCTYVRWGPAIAGTAVTTLLLHFGGQLFPLYVRWFTSDDPAIVIYGSLGLIPVFLLWLYLLWMFVLLGVEVASVAQRFPSLLDAQREQLNQSRVLVRVPNIDTALDVALRVARRFLDGKGAITVDELTQGCGIHGREVHQVLQVLQQGGLVAKTTTGWIVSRPPETIALVEVVNTWRNLTALRQGGEDVVGEEISMFLREKLSGDLATAARRWLPSEVPSPAAEAEVPAPAEAEPAT